MENKVRLRRIEKKVDILLKRDEDVHKMLDRAIGKKPCKKKRR